MNVKRTENEKHVLYNIRLLSLHINFDANRIQSLGRSAQVGIRFILVIVWYKFFAFQIFKCILFVRNQEYFFIIYKRRYHLLLLDTVVIFVVYCFAVECFYLQLFTVLRTRSYLHVLLLLLLLFLFCNMLVSLVCVFY